MLEHDQVYSQIVVEVDARFGGCPSGANNCSAYRDCNPDPSDPTGVKWRCGFGNACPYKPPPPSFALQQLPSAAAPRPRSRPVRLATLRRGASSPPPPPYWRCSEFVVSPMTSEQLTKPFVAAFEKSDPSEGGCPDLGPDFAQASATAAVGAGAGATIAAGSQNSAKERRVAATVN